MAKKKSKQTISSEVKARIFSGIVALISFLLLISIAINQDSLSDDFLSITTFCNSVLDYLLLRFPPLVNPVGPFGAVFGYITVYLWGQFFAFFLLGGVFIISMAQLFKPREHWLSSKTAWLLVFFFNLHLLIHHGSLDHDLSTGVIPWGLLQVFQNLFRETGTILVTSFLTLVSFVFLIEFDTIKIWCLRLLANMFHTSVSKKPTIQNSAIKAKPITENTIPIENKTEEEAPNINDHAFISEMATWLENELEEEEAAKSKKKENSKIVKNTLPDPIIDNREYVTPEIKDFLTNTVKLTKRDREETEEQILNVSKILKDKLAEFGIDAEVINVNIGPIITQYELKPAPGVKVSRFLSLADDLALAIKARSVRVQAPIPGRGLIGIEIPNLNRDMIYLKDVLLSEEMKQIETPLGIGLGKDISGKSVVADLAKMPHLLIAGATGSGKSVCINTIITSLVLRAKPEDVRMLLIDPKRVELAGYGGIPHMIGDVITETEDALETLHWAVREMEQRYEQMEMARVRDIIAYQQKIREEEPPEGVAEWRPMPYVVIIIDEFADLMMTAGRDIEIPITRLAQMARAVGIHLILATQRPSIKVITGIIKANFPARIAFQVSSKVDSRVILDMMGAERLLGRGDMLFIPPGKAFPERIHGAFVSDAEIEKICDYVRTQPKPTIDFKLASTQSEGLGQFEYDDELFPEAARMVVSANMASVSMLQRQFKIGYARAGRLIDMLERAGVIGPHVGSKSRDVLASEEDLRNYGYLED